MRKLTKYSIYGVVVGALIVTNTDKIAWVSSFFGHDKVAVASLTNEQEEKIKDGTHEVIVTPEMVVKSIKDRFEYVAEEIEFEAGAKFVDRKGAIQKQSESSGLLDDISNATVNAYASVTNPHRERSYSEVVPVKAKLGMDNDKLTEEDIQIKGNDIYIRLKDPALITFEVPYEKAKIDAKGKSFSEKYSEKERQRYHGIIASSIEEVLKTGKLPEKKEGEKLELNESTLEKIKEIRGKTRLSLENNLNSWNTKWNIKDAPVFHIVEDFSEIDSQVNQNNEPTQESDNDFVKDEQ